MEIYTYKTKGTCSKQIDIKMENGKLVSVIFKSGCNGNLQGISKLVEGMSVEDVINKFRGISCDGKGTSCPDQLSKALEEVLNKSKCS